MKTSCENKKKSRQRGYVGIKGLRRESPYIITMEVYILLKQFIMYIPYI